MSQPSRKQPKTATLPVTSSGEVHYVSGNEARNIHEPATLHKMIEYIHNNPVRRGLVGKPTDWPWSGARYYAGMTDVHLRMDAIAELWG